MKLELNSYFLNFKPTQSDLDNLEKLLNVKLPGDYRDFLITYNGGYSEPAGFCSPTTNNCYFLTVFYGVPKTINKDDVLDEDALFQDTSAESYKGLIKRYLVSWEEDFQRFLLPIASDFTGNLLCMSMRSEDYGKIYYINSQNLPYEFDDEGLPVSMKELTPDFNSFTDLMQSFTGEIL